MNGLNLDKFPSLVNQITLGTVVEIAEAVESRRMKRTGWVFDGTVNAEEQEVMSLLRKIGELEHICFYREHAASKTVVNGAELVSGSIGMHGENKS